jgi:ATP-binding cassette subfamily B protein
MDEFLESVPDVVDREGAVALPSSKVPRVVLDDVSFTYSGEGNEPVLRGVSLTVEPGQTVAILGSTGAGKSTLVNLIPRFYDVTSGRVVVGERDVRDLTQDSLVLAVGLVPQETILFSGTVRDNIRYGRQEASDEEVIQAAKAAQAHDFVMGLAEGYESRIEQRGTNLSGGQKQRLAIARALLVKPRILILDDSTSAVDVETETKIQDALAADKMGRTTIVVAQRISTVLNADKIVVLDKGRIVAEGTHRELMKSSPVYQEIYDSQLGGGASS